MKRRKAREYALQILYQLDFIDTRPDVTAFLRDKDAPGDVLEFTSDLVNGTREHIEEIDAELRALSTHWTLERMAAVDRNILRMAAYELLYRRDIPRAVAINEALEIAKKFSSEDSASFINGVLDKLAKKPRG